MGAMGGWAAGAILVRRQGTLAFGNQCSGTTSLHLLSRGRSAWRSPLDLAPFLVLPAVKGRW